jgi:hypothetical protein
MKILLVNPPNCGRSIPEEQYGITSLKQLFKGEPFNLEVLAGPLAGHDVLIFDGKSEAPENFRKVLEDFGPDVVGFTALTCEANTVIRQAAEVRRQSGRSWWLAAVMPPMIRSTSTGPSLITLSSGWGKKASSS